jgi:2-dehydro-3-deoxyphosphooctonate aldolase (KDO 8-P synthase)
MKLASFEVGPESPFFLIAGPCVIESAGLVVDVAGRLKEMTAALKIPFVFKASFDKANRSSRASFRGPGLAAGLKALSQVREQIGVPVLTDVHEDTPLAEVAAVVDVLQTPAFLCRQTNFIVAVSSLGKPVNIKKGQFLSPWEMQNVVDKARSTGNAQIMVCERGFSFGYNNLVSDMRSLAVMRATGCPVVFDACAPPAVRWCSTPRTRCSCPAARATPPAASASSCRCWRAPRWRPGWPESSWRRIPIPPRRCRMARTPGRWIA